MAQLDWSRKNQEYLVQCIYEIEVLLRKYIARTQRDSTQQDEEKKLEVESKLKISTEETIDDFFRHHNPPAIETLCTLFGLSDFERSILLLCAGVELKTELSILCAKAHQDPNSTYPTFGLAMAFLPDAHWNALVPTSSLRRFRLISLNDYPNTVITNCPIKIEERVLHYLTGISYLDKRLWGMMIRPIRVKATLSNSQQQVTNRILIALRKNNHNENNIDDDSGGVGDNNNNNNNNNNTDNFADNKKIANKGDYEDNNNLSSIHSDIISEISCIQLSGSDEFSKAIIARRACNKLGLDLWQIHGEFIPLRPDELEVFSELWCREASLLGSGLYISASSITDPTTKAIISKLLTSNYLPRPVFLSTREQWPSLELSTISIEVNKPLKSEQLKMWKDGLKKMAARFHLDVTMDKDMLTRLASNYDFNSFAIMSALNEAFLYLRSEIDSSARSISESSSPPSSSSSLSSHLMSVLLKSCSNISRPEMSGLSTQVIPKAQLDDLVLPNLQKELLNAISIRVKQRNKVYGDWGFERMSTRGLGITALFTGESGTGKTMAAEAIANNLKLDLFKVDLSSVVSKYIGETEKNLRQIFDAAESGGTILFFDEADALFGKRSEVKDSHDRYANIEVDYLLQLMEKYRGLAILATNMKTALDPAFIRRIAFIVKFPFPDEKSRAEIWKRIFPRSTPIEESLDYSRLAKLNITGGSIRNIALNASFLAAEDDVSVGMKHLKEATRLEYDKLEKSLTLAELNIWEDSPNQLGQKKN
jgi:SpoVK/Ycf46/Vps4 family AAA+-type ATPase